MLLTNLKHHFSNLNFGWPGAITIFLGYGFLLVSLDGKLLSLLAEANQQFGISPEILFLAFEIGLFTVVAGVLYLGAKMLGTLISRMFVLYQKL